MDQLSPAEKAEVEGYLVTHPELRNDLREIEKSLEVFAGSAALKSPSGVKERLLEAIRHEVKGTPDSSIPSKGMWPLVAALFGLGLLVLGYLLYQKDQDTRRLENEIAIVRDTCQTKTSELMHQLDILRQLTEPNNRILPFTATPGFASTDLYLHTNKATRRNFIQVRSLPALADNQSFELWAIKPNQAPIPLNVFSQPDNGLIEVTYVDGTEVYAITIEPKGGTASPTMANLIGTVSVAGI